MSEGGNLGEQIVKKLREADAMIAAMNPHGKLLTVNWPLVWDAGQQTAHRLILEGLIGEVTEFHHHGGNRGPLYHGADKIENEPTAAEKAASWFYSAAQGGGSLLDYMGYGTTLGTWHLGGKAPLEVTGVWDEPAGLEVDAGSPHWPALRAAVIAVAQELAQAIVRDGEGATKFITVNVGGGATAEECRKVAYAIGHSPLVKTAFFASDPNLGRILAAIGYAGIADLDAAGVRVWLGSGNEEVLVSEQGGRAASYREEDGSRIMKNAEITVRVDLGRGTAAATVWTCDFSYDYVKINAEYRS